MSGPATVVCPNGHESLNRDLCSVCSAWISDPSVSSRSRRPPTASTPTVVPNPGPASRSMGSSPSGALGSEVPARGGATPMAGGGHCPNCSSELDAGARFCEVCGYDPATGSMPSAPVAQPILLPPVVPPASVSAGQAAPRQAPPSQPSTSSSGPAAAARSARLLAVVTADRPYYDSQQVGDVQFPVGAPPRVIELPASPVTIGRRSRSLGTAPALDLAIPPEDPAVSHTHASLLPGDDGTWSLVDHGSTNGTFLNESPEPLPANVPRTVRPGDRIYVGAWTRITLELRSGL